MECILNHIFLDITNTKYNRMPEESIAMENVVDCNVNKC